MIPVESFTSDKHGVVYHSRAPIPVGGLRVAFITVGDTDLEFLQNFNPQQKGTVDHGSSGTTRQDQGAIAKFVASRGAGLHHVAMKTPDINAVLHNLDAAGVPVIDKKGRPGSRAGLIGFRAPERNRRRALPLRRTAKLIDKAEMLTFATSHMGSALLRVLRKSVTLRLLAARARAP